MKIYWAHDSGSSGNNILYIAQANFWHAVLVVFSMKYWRDVIRRDKSRTSLRVTIKLTKFI